MKDNSREKLIPKLDNILSLICRIDNQYPGDKDIRDLYDAMCEVRKIIKLGI